MKKTLLFLIILIVLIQDRSCENETCSQRIQFISDEHEKYGIITIPSPTDTPGNSILKVLIGVSYPITESKGSLSLGLLKSLNDTMADARAGRHLQFKLNFPESDQPQESPDILRISIDNRDICNETKISKTQEFELEHKFQNVDELRSLSSQLFSRNKRAVQPDDASWLGSLPFTGTCGRASQSTELIIGGTKVTKGEYPWMVAMFHYEGRSTVYKCGASLISNKYVITAAHCTKDQVRVQLEFGKHDINELFEPHSVARTSTKIITHIEYKDQAHGDVALVSFEPISFTQWIQPICLWANFDTKLRQGIVAGWGQQDNDDVSHSNTPKQLTISMVGLDMCRHSNVGLRKIATDKTFCAGGRRSGPCHGDSGGGFYVVRDNIWYLRGIISRSLGTIWTCNVDEYAVYADLAYSLDWIRPYLSDLPVMSPPSPAAVSTPPPPPSRVSVVQDSISQNASWLGSLAVADTCGKTLLQPKLIVGKDKVTEGEYPWMVAIYHIVQSSHNYVCGATLISNTYVITAANCTTEQDRVYLLLGKHDINDPNEEDYIERFSKNIISHPEFKYGQPHADIALIEIDYVEFTRKIKPICLWGNFDTKLQRGTVAGWGRLEPDGDISEIPMQFSVYMVGSETCKISTGLKSMVTTKTFCAGGQGFGPCHGFAGGGFYVVHRNVWYLRGIVSTTLGTALTCNTGAYSVYTYIDLFYYLDWMQQYLSGPPTPPPGVYTNWAGRP